MTDPSVQISSPLGRLRVTASRTGITHIDFLSSQATRTVRQTLVDTLEGGILQQTIAWLDTYFRGALPSPPVPPLDLQGTPFQLEVWHHLATIPWGRTQSYGEIACAIGRPKAVRAVGQACGANPIPILVPCHRIIPAGSGLGGYSAGLDRKRWLLAHEESHLVKA